MRPETRAAHDAAMTALQAAKGVKASMADAAFTAWPVEKQTQFNTAMADFATHNQNFQALKAVEVQFAAFDAGMEQYTQTQAGFYNPAGSEVVTDQAQVRANAKKRHLNAFRRFLGAGASALTREEQGAYLTGARQMFGANPMEALAGLLPAEQFALVGNVDSLGGFLVPEDFMTEMIKEIAGYTVVRPLARVRQTSRQAASFMTVAGSGNAQYSSGVTGAWRGEGWTTDQALLPTQNQPRFGRERVPVHIWCPDVIEITMELLEDSAMDLETEVKTLLAETRGQDEDSAFLLGTGVGTPKGIIQEATDGFITTVNSGASGAQSYVGLVNLYTSLAAQYRQNATFAMNSLTLGLLMQLEDTEGHHIFPTNTIPTNLFGRPIVTTEFLADGNSNNNLSMIFGDFNYYGIADRMDMRVIRLMERFAPNIGLMAVARVGGQVLKTPPFRVQKVNA